MTGPRASLLAVPLLATVLAPPGDAWRNGAAAPGRPVAEAPSGTVAPQFTPTGPTLSGAQPTRNNPSAVPAPSVLSGMDRER